MNWPFHFLWSPLSEIQLRIRVPLTALDRLPALIIIPAADLHFTLP